MNTRSLSKNFDQFQNVLSTSKTLFDVTGISETKKKLTKILLSMSTLMLIICIHNLQNLAQLVLIFTLKRNLTI